MAMHKQYLVGEQYEADEHRLQDCFANSMQQMLLYEGIAPNIDLLASSSMSSLHASSCRHSLDRLELPYEFDRPTRLCQ